MTPRLRDRRLECGLTQSELAARAGVSRQLIAAAEAGQNTPGVDAAIRLARALGSEVEQLFSSPEPAVVPALGGKLSEGAPLRVGRVGERLVAAELPDHGISANGWASPDGIVEHGELRLFPGTNLDGLVVAGCDPALGIGETMLRGLGPASMSALSSSTGTAVQALARGGVHAAVVHGLEARLPEPPVPVVRMQLAHWRVGIGLSPERDGRSVKAILDGQLPIVQREPGAVSQQALERAAAKAGRAVPKGPRAGGHIEAARIAAMRRCGALTTEAAAWAFGLRFIALEPHTVQIWLDEKWAQHPAAQALGNLLSSTAFTTRLSHVGGYDLAGCGSVIGRG